MKMEGDTCKTKLTQKKIPIKFKSGKDKKATGHD